MVGWPPFSGPPGGGGGRATIPKAFWASMPHTHKDRRGSHKDKCHVTMHVTARENLFEKGVRCRWRCFC